MQNISMLIGSCDAYSDLWMPFFYQLRKHWPGFDMPVYISTEAKKFSYDGFDIRYPPNSTPEPCWSKRLMWMLQQIPTDFVLFMLDDFWIYQDVDVVAIEKVLSYMEQDPKMGFVCMQYEPKTFLGPEKMRKKECKYPELMRCMSNDLFRITTQAGIWRRDYLLKILRKNETPWDFEIMANFRSYFYSERIYDVKKSAIIYPRGGSIWTRKLYADYLDYYEPAIIAEVKQKRGVRTTIADIPPRAGKLKHLKERSIAIFLKHFSRFPK